MCLQIGDIVSIHSSGRLVEVTDLIPHGIRGIVKSTNTSILLSDKFYSFYSKKPTKSNQEKSLLLVDTDKYCPQCGNTWSETSSPFSGSKWLDCRVCNKKKEELVD